MSGAHRGTKNFTFNLTALPLLLAFLISPAVFAHGGEDHGDAKPAVVSNQKGIMTRTIHAGDFEILLKYAPLEPDTPTTAKLFVTRFATNEPFADAEPVVEITAKDGKIFAASELKTDASGSYGFKMPPLPEDVYDISVRLNAAGRIDTATFENVAVEHPKAVSTVDSGSRLRIALMVLTAAVFSGLFGGLMYYAFRFNRSEQPGERVSGKSVPV